MAVFLYAIHCLDETSNGIFTIYRTSCSANFSNYILLDEMVENGSRFGGSQKRMSIYKEHKGYQTETSDINSKSFIKKVSAGPLVIGSVFFYNYA